MPATLVIPDIHNDVARAESIIVAQAGRFSQIVFLGDYFDDFDDTPQDVYRVAEWLRDSITQTNRIHLIGNHDLAYIAPNSFTRCAGWTPEKMRAVSPVLSLIPRERIHVAVEIDGWLLSHAGFAPCFTGSTSTTASGIANWADSLLRQLVAGGRPRLFAAGQSRGGIEPVGGVTWCDWDSDFAPTPGIHQIVGHTPCQHVRVFGIDADGWKVRQVLHCTGSATPPPLDSREYESLNLCLDTGLSSAALIDGNTITLLPTGP